MKPSLDRSSAKWALLASLVVLFASMVAGAYTGSQLVVGSIHTTDSDFQAGTLANMSATGGTIQLDSSKSESVDDFEDGDISTKTGWMTMVIDSGVDCYDPSSPHRRVIQGSVDEWPGNENQQ